MASRSRALLRAAPGLVLDAVTCSHCTTSHSSCCCLSRRAGCTTCSLPADFHYIQRDRHTVLRWRSLRPLFERILSVGRDKEAYRQLAWDEVRWEI